MTDESQELTNNISSGRLYGWDDEKIYFWLPETGEKCVSDEPELIGQLVVICANYFRRRAAYGKG